MNKFTHKEVAIPKLERTTAPSGTRVYQTPSGTLYPSVTTVTGLLKKDIIDQWKQRVGEAEATRISKHASSRGTRIHQLCEDYLSNRQVTLENMLDHDIWSSLKLCLDDINHIHALESTLYSDHLQVAGTVDCIAQYKGKLSVIDFKTSKREKDKADISDYFMQCAAYAVAFEERTGIPVSQLVIIMGIDDSPTKIFIEKRDDWVEGFIRLREEYRRQNNI